MKVPDDRTLLFGSETVDVACVEQLVLRGQTRTVGECLAWVATDADTEGMTLPEMLDAVEGAMNAHGPDAFVDGRFGDLAFARRMEVAATMNRLRSLRVE